jgi:hypothetical protein
VEARKDIDVSFSVSLRLRRHRYAIIVVHNYTGIASPAQILLDGVALTANSDYFISLRPGAAELWITLNRQLAGTHNLQIIGCTAHRFFLPVVMR